MILEVKQLTFSYGNRFIYSGFNLKADSSDRIGLMAPSGFGKTTLCKLIAGYEKPISGEILLDGKAVTKYRGYNPIQMIWQHPETVVNPKLKIKHVLMEGDFGCTKESELKKVFTESGGDPLLRNIVQGLGIREEWLERYPQELSGGELQRFCIARAFGRNTRFILADEISTMLDLITQKQIWSFILKEIEMRSIGMITVSHSHELLNRLCTQVINLTENTL